MEINVSVKPNSKFSEVTKVDDKNYKVKIDAPASKGKANKRLIELLAEHFKVSKSSISIIKGLKSRNKIVRVEI